jgi:hypothetical protein
MNDRRGKGDSDVYGEELIRKLIYDVWTGRLAEIDYFFRRAKVSDNTDIVRGGRYLGGYAPDDYGQEEFHWIISAQISNNLLPPILLSACISGHPV